MPSIYVCPQFNERTYLISPYIFRSKILELLSIVTNTQPLHSCRDFSLTILFNEYPIVANLLAFKTI